LQVQGPPLPLPQSSSPSAWPPPRAAASPAAEPAREEQAGEERLESCAKVIRDSIQDGKLDRVVSLLSGSHVRALGVAAFSHHYGKDIKEEFERADKDDDGSLCKAEFRRYIAKVLPQHHQSDASRPTNRQLALFSLNSAIPFVVFGFLDNSIMIIGGDVVDDLIGSTLQLSTLACAALANTFADVLGISIGNTVESVTAKLGLPPANLTVGQSGLPLVRRLGLASGSGGILLGCILGMCPLLLMDPEKREKEKLAAELAAE